MVTYGPSCIPLAPGNSMNNKYCFITAGLCRCLQGKEHNSRARISTQINPETACAVKLLQKHDWITMRAAVD